MRSESKNERDSLSDGSSSRSNSVVSSSYEDKKQVRFDKETKKISVNNKNDPYSKRAISCTIPSKPNSARNTYSDASRKTQSAFASSSYNAPTNNDLLEWNKMQAKKKLKEKREKELKELLFEDKKLMKKYLDLCEIRDNVPKEPPERIEYLKQHDPVFAKRHKLFKTALVCNKAPTFDMNDYFFQVKMPKSLITKHRIDIVNETNTKTNVEPKIYQKEMEKADEKVKRFIREISEL